MNQEQYLKRGIEIIKTLTSFAYQAYLIGGVVRDYVMNNEFNDIDIATNATPEQVKELFPTVKMEYAHLGFVTLKEDGVTFEISTFREEVYDKPRKPSKIYYAENLVDDVKRRDFTINALALTDNYQVVDLVKGLKDIKRKRVRIIGKGKVRFKEDPLRIFRAYNLVARFNFRIAGLTEYAIRKSNKYLKDISNYQLSRELHKIFEAKYGRKAVRYIVELNSHKKLEDYSTGLEILASNYKKFDMIEKFVLCYAVNKKIPDNTCFDKVTLSKIQSILNVCEETKVWTKENEQSVTPLDVFNYGADLLLSATKINHYLQKNYPNITKKISKMSKQLPIHSMSDMKFHGADLVEANNGQTGPYIKEVMDELSKEVVLGLVENEYRVLRQRALELLNNNENTTEGEILEPHEVVNNIEEVKSFENPTDELITIKIKYDLEYTELLKTNMASFVKGHETPEELEKLEAVISKNIREALIIQNPEYQLLEQKGLI